jgi:molybdate transport system substrate-binding protein
MKLGQAVLAAALALAVQPAGGTITVSAAISLTEALEAVTRAYEAAGGGTVRLNVAGSNTLARQIVSGAPVDLFISADEAQMDAAARAGAIDAATRVDLLGNRLAIFTLPGREVADPSALYGPGFRRIAIGDPAAVPAGVYARKFLEAVGLWGALQPKLVPVSNVRAAVAALENGSAEAAIAYETDVSAMKTARAALVISGPAAPRIVYPAAILSSSTNRAGAARFLAYLCGPEAVAIFRQYKFVPLSPRR